TAPLGVVTKQYADAIATAKVDRAGDTMTGKLPATGFQIGATDLIPTTPNKLGVLADASASHRAATVLVGQDAAHFAQLVWSYNATAGSAQAYLNTTGYSNPLNVDASVLNLQIGSGNAVNVPTPSANDNTTKAMNMATHSAWGAWTPTVTSWAGGPPTVATTAIYKQINKVVLFYISIAISAQNGA